MGNFIFLKYFFNMAPAPGMFGPAAVRVIRQALKKTSNLIKIRLANIGRPLESQLQPILVRSSPRHPVHPTAALRQAKGRWYTTHSTINKILSLLAPPQRSLPPDTPLLSLLLSQLLAMSRPSLPSTLSQACPGPTLFSSMALLTPAC